MSRAHLDTIREHFWHRPFRVRERSVPAQAAAYAWSLAPLRRSRQVLPPGGQVPLSICGHDRPT